jgi:hypothetical protein
MKRAAIIVATAAFGIGAGIGISACGGDDTTTTVIQPSGGAKKKAEETSGSAGEEKAEAKGTTTTTGTDTTTTDDDNGGGGEDDNGADWQQQRTGQRQVLTNASTSFRAKSSSPAEELHVLPRHRLLRQPGGFEGAVLARKGLDPHDPSVAQRE